MSKLLFLPFKLALGVLKLSGVKGSLLLLIGVGIGLLIAPQRGAKLRAELLERVGQARAGAGLPADADLSL